MGTESMKPRATLSFLSSGSRPEQEDFLMADASRGIFAVADGFGGASAGERAARSACEAVKGFLLKGAGDLDATLPFVLRSYFSLASNVLFNALIHANRQVLLLNGSKSVNEKGGASVVAGYVDGDLLALANVGVCTAWLYREGRGVELVVPRSYARLHDPFNENPPEQHQIPMMAIGTAQDLEPEIIECRLKPGDCLVLHSDGVSGSQREAALALYSQALSEGLDSKQALERVDDFLKSSMFTDNSSILLAVF